MGVRSIVVVGLAALVLQLGFARPAVSAAGEANTCRKVPAGKRVVKLTLKPDTEISDLIAWISSVTCKQFFVPGSIDVHGKKVTIIAPELITKEEAYRLFLDALDSVDLTVEPTGNFLRIIETSKAKTSPIPFYVGRGNVPAHRR
jgi:general secretion pathway protein D